MTVHRYHRQTLLEGIGTKGQERLRSASVLVAGVGELGCAVADHLVRAGIGHLRLIDRDLVEPTNLQRQCLFAEDDVGSPKAAAAATRLQAINREVKLDIVVDDLRPTVASDMVVGCDAIADGLDNFATRFLLNDLSVKFGLPYAYGGAVGYEGTAAFLRPSPLQRQHLITREILE
ncbi:MAG: HesA/MoeB/ThiF family protein, partial [Planctomycetota bacterium]